MWLLRRVVDLHRHRTISEAEFDAAKRLLLNGTPTLTAYPEPAAAAPPSPWPAGDQRGALIAAAVIAVVVVVGLLVVQRDDGPVTGSGLVAELNGDREIVPIRMEAGCDVQIEVIGVSWFDPVATLSDPTGLVIDHDDDGAGQLNSYLSTIPHMSGVWELEVTGYGGTRGRSEVHLYREC